MKPFVKNLMKGAAFLTGVVLILALLSPLFTPKASIGSIDDEPENTLDYIVIGDSEGFAICGVICPESCPDNCPDNCPGTGPDSCPDNCPDNCPGI